MCKHQSNWDFYAIFTYLFSLFKPDLPAHNAKKRIQFPRSHGQSSAFGPYIVLAHWLLDCTHGSQRHKKKHEKVRNKFVWSYAMFSL